MPITGAHEEQRATGRIDLVLLGGFELRWDGATVRLLMDSQRLVAFLGLHERPVRRAYIAETLWSDVPDRRAWGNLRTSLWRLGALRGRVVEQLGDHMRLARAVVVDVHEATRAAGELLAGTFAGDARLDMRAFERDLLPGWCEEWITIERERHRQLGLDALEVLCERLTSEGDWRRAVQAGLAAVLADPLRESARRSLIAAHLAAGNVHDAIRQFEVYESLVKEELGLEPSEQLKLLITGLGEPQSRTRE